MTTAAQTSVFDRITPQNNTIRPPRYGYSDKGMVTWDTKLIPHTMLNQFNKLIPHTMLNQNQNHTIVDNVLVQDWKFEMDRITEQTEQIFTTQQFNNPTADIWVFKKPQFEFIEIKCQILPDLSKHFAHIACLTKEDLSKDDKQVIKILKDGGFNKTVCGEVIANKQQFRTTCVDTLKLSANDPAVDKLIDIIEYMFNNYDTLDKTPEDAYEHAMSII